MTKAELISQIAISSGYDKKTIGVVVEGFMKGVKNCTAKGENVYLRGFGTFLCKTRKAKVARNISKSMSIHVPEHKVVVFKAAKEFATAIRK